MLVTSSSELEIVEMDFAVGVWRSINFDEPQISRLSPRLPDRICQFRDEAVQALSNGRHSMEALVISNQCAWLSIKACGKSPLKPWGGSNS